MASDEQRIEPREEVPADSATGSTKAQLVRRPLVFVATAFILGVMAAGRADNLAGNVALTVTLALFSALLAHRRRIFSVFLLLIAFWAAGVVSGQLRLPPKETLSSRIALDQRAPLLLEGIVAESADRLPDADRIVIDLIGTSTSTFHPLVPVSGRIRVRIGRNEPGPPCGLAGDRIRVWARADRFDDQTFPGGVSPSAFAARRGIALKGWAAAGHCVRVVEGETSGVRVWLERLRDRVRSGIENRLPERDASLVRAFATGDRSGIPPAVRQDFVSAGLSHLLAISGLHLAIVSGLFVVILAWAFRFSERICLGIGAKRLAAIFAIPFVLFYTLLVGASPSAIRAAVMVLALLFAHLLLRLREAWSALALALLLMLAWDPATLGDVSFQLSFAAVAGLLRIFPALRTHLFPRIKTFRPWGRYPVEIILASAAATIGTTPLVARHFQHISLIGLVANVPATPLASLVVVPFSLVGGLLGAVNETLGLPFLWIAGEAAGLLVALAHFAGNLPGAAVDIPTPSIFECVVFYGATISLSALPVRRGAIRFGLACVALLVVLIGSQEIAKYTRDEVRITFLPVGQGDGVVVELPGGRVMVVDTGPVYPGYDTADRVILPFLLHRRIRHIDYLVITHPHTDHSGGLRTLAKEISIGEVWWNGDRREAPAEVLQPLDTLEAKVVTASTAPVLIKDTRIEFLWPMAPIDAEPQEEASWSEVNEGSIVLRISHRGSQVLLTGDIEHDTEEALVQCCAKSLRATILKAGHHGSRSSSTETFIDAVQPKHVVMTVGRKNRFGFPHPIVTQRYSDRSVGIWRTDRHGAITVILDEEGARVEPFSL